MIVCRLGKLLLRAIQARRSTRRLSTAAKPSGGPPCSACRCPGRPIPRECRPSAPTAQARHLLGQRRLPRWLPWAPGSPEPPAAWEARPERWSKVPALGRQKGNTPDRSNSPKKSVSARPAPEPAPTRRSAAPRASAPWEAAGGSPCRVWPSSSPSGPPAEGPPPSAPSGPPGTPRRPAPARTPRRPGRLPRWPRPRRAWWHLW
mmetsp:Transcript_9004/g.23066  ORF Transcript_9004/g.23066 Transcript_9004/m.23066 type:complete len:204 (-) Transcript_9004:223-834(-)